MKNGIVWGFCAALASFGLLMPPAAGAQQRGGAQNRSGFVGRTFQDGGFQNRGGTRDRDGFRDRGGDRDRGGFRDRGFRGRTRFRSSFSFWFGPYWDPWWGPFAYADPYYYPRYRYYPGYPYYPYRYYTPPPVVTQPPVEEVPVPEPQEEAYSWYYCQDPAGYYPYVRECPSGWTKVAPDPEATPPAVAEPQAPPAPDQRDPVPEEYRWYYCEDPPGYYPYVRDCPKGWTEVAPQPAPAR